ncbi:hypothetical protein [Brevibacillus centrosporus]|uniref:hypothetical protein n=1 Tax=Brevibacillus centrosporus TaxID=54910 RepID=UPI003985AC86
MGAGSDALTVTLKVDSANPPQGSVSIHVTVVVPTGKNDPGGGSHVTVLPAGQLSDLTEVSTRLYGKLGGIPAF